jgi:hypothetical protein
VGVRQVDAGALPLDDLERLFALTSRLARVPRTMSQPVRDLALKPVDADDVDLTLDLVGIEAPGSPATWQLRMDGHPGADGAVPALVHGRFPTATVIDLATGEPLVEGRPGSEYPGSFATAYDETMARVVELVGLSLDGRRLRLPEEAASPAPPFGWPSRRDLRERLVRTVVSDGLHRAYRALYRAPHWRVGWRLVEGPGVLESGSLGGGWSVLPDDGYHFYADPFPVDRGSAMHLFVEDYDHRTGKGVVAVTEVGASGPLSQPRPVLEHDTHLSYPCVVEDGGEFWMIPETAGASRVELYRAVRYPDVWTLEGVLVDGLAVSDATPFRHGGRWWMTGTVRGHGSFSDALHVWTAERLTGPWTPHPRNPVLVDISSARPAGHVRIHDGRLLRPVQDGRAGYGGALAIAEIVQLDDEDVVQRVLGRLTPGPTWPGRRLHTVNRSGRLECIDGSAMSPRWRPRSRRSTWQSP